MVVLAWGSLCPLHMHARAYACSHGTGEWDGLVRMHTGFCACHSLPRAHTRPTCVHVAYRMRTCAAVSTELGEARLASCSLPAAFSCYASVEYDPRRAAVAHAGLESLNRTAHKVWTTLSRTKLRRKRRMSGPVLAVLLGDYVEHVASWAVGACNVALFLDRCF